MRCDSVISVLWTSCRKVTCPCGDGFLSDLKAMPAGACLVGARYALTVSTAVPVASANRRKKLFGIDAGTTNPSRIAVKIERGTSIALATAAKAAPLSPANGSATAAGPDACCGAAPRNSCHASSKPGH